MPLNEIVTQSIMILVAMILLGMVLRIVGILKEKYFKIFTAFISSFFSMVIMMWLV
ncbi:MAG: hypothetical protein IEMM0006_2263 [bacterium]|nr:MAG: hypothetical protein IEMM0006_2263 [bacterium]